MRPNRKAFYPDIIVAIVCLLIAVGYIGFEIGRSNRPLVCAKVEGLVPVSSTADTCTYVIGTRGRAYWKFLAEKEGQRHGG